MNKLTKVLKQHGIIYQSDDWACSMGPEYDEAQCLIAIDYKAGIIIMEYSNAALPSEFRIYDARTLTLIGGQQIDRDNNPYPFCGFGSWADVPYDFDSLELD